MENYCVFYRDGQLVGLFTSPEKVWKAILKLKRMRAPASKLSIAKSQFLKHLSDEKWDGAIYQSNIIEDNLFQEFACVCKVKVDKFWFE